MNPFFSVVMPTRNRSDLLFDNALPSILAQGDEDVEIIICDNASSDDTQHRASKINHPKVRYVRSDVWIPKEKFFEYALTQATGQYAMLFFDDDVLLNGALEKAHGILEAYRPSILSYSRALVYHYPNWHAPHRKNTLSIPPFSGQLYVKNGREHLEEIYTHREILPNTPMVTNSLFNTAFIQTLINQHGTLFPHGHMGDYNIACYTLDRSETFYYLDEPLAIFGHWSDNGSEQLHEMRTTMPEYLEWIDWVKETLLVDMPVQCYLWANCVSAALMDMKKRLDFPFDVSWPGYFLDLKQEIARLEKKNVNLAEQKAAFEKALESKSEDFKQQMKNSVQPFPGPGDPVEIPIPKHANTTDLSTPAYPLLGNSESRFRGELFGFSGIWDAKQFYERLVQMPTPDDIMSPFKESGVRDFIYGILALNESETDRIVLVGAGSIATICHRVLARQVVGIVDSNAALHGTPFGDQLTIRPLETIKEALFDLALITVPNADGLDDQVRMMVRSNPHAPATVLNVKHLINGRHNQRQSDAFMQGRG